MLCQEDTSCSALSSHKVTTCLKTDVFLPTFASSQSFCRQATAPETSTLNWIDPLNPLTPTLIGVHDIYLHTYLSFPLPTLKYLGTLGIGLWHPGDINSFCRMGELMFKQVKGLPLISFPWFLFFSCCIHLISMWIFLEVFLQFYSGHFLLNWRWDFLSSFLMLLAIYILPPIFLCSQASRCYICHLGA